MNVKTEFHRPWVTCSGLKVSERPRIQDEEFLNLRSPHISSFYYVSKPKAGVYQARVPNTLVPCPKTLHKSKLWWHQPSTQMKICHWFFDFKDIKIVICSSINYKQRNARQNREGMPWYPCKIKFCLTTMPSLQNALSRTN